MNQTALNDVIQTIVNKTPDEHKKVVELSFQKERANINEHAIDVLRAYTQLRYNQLDDYLKTVLPSTYAAWFLFMDDDDFLDAYTELISGKLSQTILDKLKNDKLFRAVYYTLRRKIWNRLP